MNILIVPSWYKSKNDPLNGSYFFEQALALSKYGNKIFVADVSYQGFKNYLRIENFFIKKSIEYDIITYCLTMPNFYFINKFPKLANLLFRIRLKIVYKKMLCDKIKIDIIHAHSFFPAGISASVIAREENIPLVVTEHSSEFFCDNISAYKRKILYETINIAKIFICVSEALKKRVQYFVPLEEKIIVIPNIISNIFFTSSLESHRGFNIVSIGYLRPGKKFDLLIEAFKKSFQYIPDVRLLIVGGGKEEKVLQEKINFAGLNDKIELIGFLKRKEVVEVLRKADLFALVSSFETFGIAYGEAAAMGIPMIGTYNGGAEEIINEDIGILVPKNNIEAIAVAMEYMYIKASTYDKNNIRNAVYNRFSEKVVCEKINNIYSKCLQGKN